MGYDTLGKKRFEQHGGNIDQFMFTMVGVMWRFSRKIFKTSYFLQSLSYWSEISSAVVKHLYHTTCEISKLWSIQGGPEKTERRISDSFPSTQLIWLDGESF